MIILFAMHDCPILTICGQDYPSGNDVCPEQLIGAPDLIHLAGYVCPRPVVVDCAVWQPPCQGMDEYLDLSVFYYSPVLANDVYLV
jgi:hypothetical protein